MEVEIASLLALASVWANALLGSPRRPSIPQSLLIIQEPVTISHSYRDMEACAPALLDSGHILCSVKLVSVFLTTFTI